MATYPQLSLREGGGVTASRLKADQVHNTASVIIGLGGQGVQTLRRLKTEVHDNLKPDAPDSILPQYRHIRFLAADSDDRSIYNRYHDGLLGLDYQEYFSIANVHLRHALGNAWLLKSKREFSWLNLEGIPLPNFGNASAGGIRQVGRYMMMDRSRGLLDRIEREIEAARNGLENPTVNIHIIAGLGGGTGSGTFLDVCYMVRHIAKTLGPINLFGYFYLPEVILNQNPGTVASNVKHNILANGYAALQELDHCMQLPHNGSSFVQEYEDGIHIDWKEPPVDICHLIGAGTEGVLRLDSIGIVCESLLQDLMQRHQGNAMTRQLNHMIGVHTVQAMGQTDACIKYAALGAASLLLPRKKILTYLASELFHRFDRIFQNTPSRADEEALAIRALAPDIQSIGSLYDCLYSRMHGGFSLDYKDYELDWRAALRSNSDELVCWYRYQNNVKLGQMGNNIRDLTDTQNQTALICNIRSVLAEIARSIDYGPVFVCKLLDASQPHNLLRIIDALIAENNDRRACEAAQRGRRMEEYERSRSDFWNRTNRRFLDTNQHRFWDYENCVRLLMRHELELELYAGLDWVLTTLRNQVVMETTGYYGRLSRVLSNLADTFRENRDLLAQERDLWADGGAVIPMMTISELKPTLDQEVKGCNAPALLDAFVAMLQQHEAIWYREDADRLTKLVGDFLTNTVFDGVASRPAASFLQSRYPTVPNNALGDTICDQLLIPLAQEAVPVVCFDRFQWNPGTCQIDSTITASNQGVIQPAVSRFLQANGNWRRTDAYAASDRISAVRVLSGFPIYGCVGSAEASVHIRETSPGRYLYENPEGGRDWRELPLLHPSHAR